MANTSWKPCLLTCVPLSSTWYTYCLKTWKLLCVQFEMLFVDLQKPECHGSSDKCGVLKRSLPPVGSDCLRDQLVMWKSQGHLQGCQSSSTLLDHFLEWLQSISTGTLLDLALEETKSYFDLFHWGKFISCARNLAVSVMVLYIFKTEQTILLPFFIHLNGKIYQYNTGKKRLLWKPLE